MKRFFITLIYWLAVAFSIGAGLACMFLMLDQWGVGPTVLIWIGGGISQFAIWYFNNQIVGWD